MRNIYALGFALCAVLLAFVGDLPFLILSYCYALAALGTIDYHWRARRDRS